MAPKSWSWGLRVYFLIITFLPHKIKLTWANKLIFLSKIKWWCSGYCVSNILIRFKTYFCTEMFTVVHVVVEYTYVTTEGRKYVK